MIQSKDEFEKELTLFLNNNTKMFLTPQAWKVLDGMGDSFDKMDFFEFVKKHRSEIGGMIIFNYLNLTGEKE